MDLAQLRKMRNTDFSKISNEFEKMVNPEVKSYGDDRFWKLEVDKAGNGTAVIRFLPRTVKTVDGKDVMDELPWVRVFNHGFQGPTGRWFIEDCPTTLGESCPVCEQNSGYWNSGIEADKEIARKQKRKLAYIANVYIVSDPKHPENEGQVRLFRFGKKIFDKIMDKARPTFEDEDPVNVFDLWEGADFKLRQRKVEGYPNYDQSTFGSPSAIAESEEDILEIVNRQYLLKDFVDPSKFKSYDELSKKLEAVLNSKPVGSAREFESADDDGDTTKVAQNAVRTVDTKRTSIPTSNSKASLQSDSGDSDDDDGDTMAYFRNLVNDD